MFLIPGIGALFTFLYLRPQEVFELLRPVTLVWVLSVVVLGLVLDVRVGATRLRSSPLLTLAIALFAFCFLTVAIKAPGQMPRQIVSLVPPLVVFLFVSQGLQTLRALEVAAAILLTLTLVVAGVAVEQGLSQPVCYVYGGGPGEGGKADTLDGRPCETSATCREGGLPNKEYLCEHPGVFNTHSVRLRVRYRGTLEDPNELSWMISMVLPLSFGFYERKKTTLRLGILLATLAVGAVAVVMSESRSGQLSMAGVLAVYFIRRFGWKGAVAAAAASLPVLLLGGRSGADADSSSEERLECWSEALQMLRESPIVGVGQGQFTEHHFLTAHNSFLLAVAELGPIGFVLWTSIVFLAFKIVISAQIDFADLPAAKPARIWASSLTASLVGMVVSAFFLSLCYHVLLWMFIGLVGALYGMIRRHFPSWRVRFTWRDLFIVIATDVAVVFTIAVYLRIKGV